jgi:hypothetical protein
MRFRITGQGWRLDRSTLVPANTVIDASASDRWSKRARGLPPPINATALDREAFEAQLAAYPEHKHLLGGGWI